MSPEYALYGHFSDKLDVFSFGVLLLEIVSGRKNAIFDHSLTLAEWVSITTYSLSFRFNCQQVQIIISR